MDKKKQINFNLNNFLLAVSPLLDNVDNQKYNTSVNHSKRVAYLSLHIAKELNLDPEEMFDLCAYSLCHNLTLNTNEAEESYLNNLNQDTKKLPFISKHKDVLKYQNEKYDGSGVFGIKNEETSMLSQILSFSHYLDEKFDLSNSDIENRILIQSFVNENKGSVLNPDFAEIFTKLSKQTSFWLDLQNDYETLYYIYANLHDFTVAMDFEKVLELTSIIFKTIDKNSLLIKNCGKICDYYKFDHKDKYTLLISASLCTIGKLMIPSSILNKNTTLTSNEYELIKSYPYYTQKALNNVMGFNDISTWSSRVQENILSSGYPFSLGSKDLSFKDLLLSSMVIYSSLTESKLYRKAYTHNESIVIMKKLVDEKVLDNGIITDIEKLFNN